MLAIEVRVTDGVAVMISLPLVRVADLRWNIRAGSGIGPG
jgi:hypothetical protein